MNDNENGFVFGVGSWRIRLRGTTTWQWTKGGLHETCRDYALGWLRVEMWRSSDWHLARVRREGKANDERQSRPG